MINACSMIIDNNDQWSSYTNSDTEYKVIQFFSNNKYYNNSTLIKPKFSSMDINEVY